MRVRSTPDKSAARLWIGGVRDVAHPHPDALEVCFWPVFVVHVAINSVRYDHD